MRFFYPALIVVIFLACICISGSQWWLLGVVAVFIQSCKDGERVWRELVAEVERMHRWQGLAGLRADQAEAAIKPLVEALRPMLAFMKALMKHDPPRDMENARLVNGMIVLAERAIAAYEESKK